jgi:hypothetical protein
VRRTALARCVVLDQVIEAQLRRDGRLDNRYALQRTCCSYSALAHAERQRASDHRSAADAVTCCSICATNRHAACTYFVVLVHKHVVCVSNGHCKEMNHAMGYVNNSFKERLAAGLAIAQLSEAERRKKQEDARTAEAAAVAAAAAAADAAAAARSGGSAATAAAAAAQRRGEGAAWASRYATGIQVTVILESVSSVTAF